MRRENLEIICIFAQTLFERVGQLMSGSFLDMIHSCCCFKQIWPSYVAHKKEIPANQSHRLRCSRPLIRDEKTNMFRCMPRSPKDIYTNPTDEELIPML